MEVDWQLKIHSTISFVKNPSLYTHISSYLPSLKPANIAYQMRLKTRNNSIITLQTNLIILNYTQFLSQLREHAHAVSRTWAIGLIQFKSIDSNAEIWENFVYLKIKIDFFDGFLNVIIRWMNWPVHQNLTELKLEFIRKITFLGFFTKRPDVRLIHKKI